MIRIAVDAMGGDFAPGEVVAGAVEAARQSPYRLILVGRPDAVEAELARCPRPGFDAQRAPTDLLPNGTPYAIHPAAGAEDIIAKVAQGRSRAWQHAAAGHAFWWAAGQSGEPRLLVTRGLPPIDDMRLLFGAASTES